MLDGFWELLQFRSTSTSAPPASTCERVYKLPSLHPAAFGRAHGDGRHHASLTKAYNRCIVAIIAAARGILVPHRGLGGARPRFRGCTCQTHRIPALPVTTGAAGSKKQTALCCFGALTSGPLRAARVSIMPRRAPSFGSMRRKRAFLDVSNRPRQRSLLRRLEAAKIAIAPSLDAQVNIFVTDRIAAASAAPTTRITLRRGGKRQRGQKLIEASLKRTAQGSGAPIRDLAKTAAQRGILVLSCDQIEREMTRMGVPANPVPTVHASSSSSSSRGKKTKRKPLPRVVLSDADHLYLPIIKEFSSPTDSKSTAAGPPCPVLNPDAAEGS